MAADNGEMLKPDGDAGGELDHEWWSALRRTIWRVLDLLESSARTDAESRADLMRVLGRLPTTFPAAELAPPATTAPTAPDRADTTEAPVEPTDLDLDQRAAGVPVTAPVAAPPPHSQIAPANESPPNESPPSSVAPTPAPLPHVPQPSPLVGPRIVEPPAVAQYPRQWTRPPFEPARVEMSCRLKAEACRWQAQRRRMLENGEDVSDGDHALLARARAADVFLWMVVPAKWRERADAAFATVAGCYDTLADAAELMGLADRLGQQQEPSMRLLAEAQSAVRAAVEDYGSTRLDEDQEVTFAWLREQTYVRRVYAEYMQKDNPAPPDNHEQLRRRIAAVRELLDAVRRRGQSVEDVIRKLAWHARKLAQYKADAPARASDDDVAKMAEAAAHLEQQGVPPSDVRLRELLLLPVFDRLAAIDAQELERHAPALCRILESVADHLDQAEANREALEQRPDAGGGAEDPLVARAGALVAGRDAILIGGTPSELHRARLERGLGLRSLIWLRLEHHESFDAAATAIRRPNVKLVMVMTRWRSHRDGPAARDLCRRLGIPLVELPAGYNLRQVAHRIIEQVGA